MCVCISYVHLSLSSSLTHSSAWQVLCVSVYITRISLSVFFSHLHGRFNVCLCILCVSLSVFLSHTPIWMAGFICVCVYYVYLSVFVSHTLICMAGFMCVCVYYGVATVSRISFAEYYLFYRALLQKRPMILSILITKATPYVHVSLSLSLTHSSAWHVWQVFFVFFCLAGFRCVCVYYIGFMCRSFSAKEPLIIGLFCGKWPI